MKKHQSGFTLVEIAIVLVIIGLLLGGVLKGQAMIENAKIRNVTNDLNAIQAAYYGYMDRYKALPGDDKLVTRFIAAGPVGDGSGTIDGTWVPTAGTETEKFWQHLRYAGLVKGAGTDTTNPVSALEGKIGVEPAPQGLTGHAVCTSVPSKYAQGIDANLDDGVATTGDVRGSAETTVNAASGTATAYGAPTDGKYITICRKL
jgi:prepilin-type N-terminal cleavage/methylation domain-containing protein